MPLGKSENRVNGIGQTGDAAGRLARRNHAVEYGANFVEQRGDRGSVGGKLLAELTNVLAPVARRIDAAVAEHVAVVDAPPFDLLGDAEALEDAVQRAAGMEPRKIVRAGVEAINADRALMPLPAMKVLAEAAGDGFRLVDGDLEPRVGDEGGRGEPADPRPDNRDVETVALGEIGRRPTEFARPRDLQADHEAYDRVDAEDRNERAEREQARRRPCGPA